MKNFKRYKIKPDDSMLEIIRVIDKNKGGTAVVVNDRDQLQGVITDGDIRRQMLNGAFSGKRAKDIMCKNPVTAGLTAKENDLKALMQKHRITSIPLLSKNRIPKKIVFLRDLLSNARQQQTVVIMAGGQGQRLKPLTHRVPKPLLKVGGKSILESIIERLASLGFWDIYITINYKAEMISKTFKQGEKYRVNIKYIHEKKTMGTAGALSFLKDGNISDSILLINSDLVTETDFSQVLDFHHQHCCMMTVASVQYNLKVPYGVLRLMGHYVHGIDEKPQQQFYCNAGIYVINKELLRFIPPRAKYDMTDLISTVIDNGLPVTTFPVREKWIDIGNRDQLKRARQELKTNHKKKRVRL